MFQLGTLGVSKHRKIICAGGMAGVLIVTFHKPVWGQHTPLKEMKRSQRIGKSIACFQVLPASVRP